MNVGLFLIYCVLLRFISHPFAWFQTEFSFTDFVSKLTNLFEGFEKDILPMFKENSVTFRLKKTMCSSFIDSLFRTSTIRTKYEKLSLFHVHLKRSSQGV